LKIFHDETWKIFKRCSNDYPNVKAQYPVNCLYGSPAAYCFAVNKKKLV
jgi:hypothetical protein